MEIFYSTDCDHLPAEIENELLEQFNCNLEGSEMGEQWLDAEQLPEHVRIISEEEMEEERHYWAWNLNRD